MLIFELARLADDASPIMAGRYNVPVRSMDHDDSLSTVNSQSTASFVSVDVAVSPKTFTIEEPGHAVSVILDDTAAARNRCALQETASTAERTCVAKLLLLRYDAIKPHKNAIWILKRELRRQGLDICFDGSSVFVGAVEVAGTQSSVNLVGRFKTLSDRDGSLLDRDILQSKTVLIVGLGSVGSVLACDLARSGVGRFIIADHQRLEWGNVVRHAAGISDAGRLKTRIVADLIRDRNPISEVVEVSSELASDSKEAYDHAVAESHVVVCATDNRASRLICNRLSVKHRRKLILGGLTTGAYAGMVFQCHSPETMCYHCFVSSFPDAAADRESDDSGYAGGPDGHLALDIAPITTLMAKLVVVELQKQSGAPIPSGLEDDLRAPWYIWINRREGEYSDLAPLCSPTKGPQILQWRSVTMDKVEGCPHCG